MKIWLKKIEVKKLNLEGIIPGNSREDINWRALAMYARKLEHTLEKWQNDRIFKVAFQKSVQIHRNRK